MTLRSAGLVTDPITGPRSAGEAAPQRIGNRAAPVPGSGCEVNRIWVLRLSVLMAAFQTSKTPRAPRGRRRRGPSCTVMVTPAFRNVNAGPEDTRMATRWASDPARSRRMLRQAEMPRDGFANVGEGRPAAERA